MLLVAVLWLKCQAGRLAAPMRSTLVAVGLPPLHEKPLQSGREGKLQGGGVPVFLGPCPSLKTSPSPRFWTNRSSSLQLGSKSFYSATLL